MKALPNLDFIRGVAVLSVVFAHVMEAYKIFSIGYWATSWVGVLGVFIFFVHTSLVLLWSLERKPHTLDFYIRRVFRIYPLAILAVLVTVLFHAPAGGPFYDTFVYVPYHNTRELMSAFLLVGNLTHPYQPVSVMWSLTYEMEMYLALPVIFFFVRRNFSVWPLILYWIFIVAVSRPLFGNGYNFFLCIPYFLPGVMAYVGFGRLRPILPAWLLPITLAGIYFLFMRWPSGWRKADFLCLALGLALPNFRQISSKWLMRASHELATYSYSIYLAHPFSIILGVYLFPHRSVVLQLTVILISLVVFSVSAYQLLEKPMIRLGARLAQRAELRFEQMDASVKRRKPEDWAVFESRPTE